MAVLDLLKNTLQPIYIKIVVAAIIVIFGLIFGQLLGKLVKKILSEIRLDRFMRKVTGLSIKLESLIAILVKYSIIFIFIIWALDRIGLGYIVLNILAGGAVIIIIMAFVLSIKDFIPNAIAGAFVQIKRIVREGDQIKCNNVEGTVQTVDLVETKIKATNGDIIFIPNSNLVKNTVVKKA